MDWCTNMMRMTRHRVPPGKLEAAALYEYALRALGRRSHTRAEMDAKIRKRCADVADVEVVVERLRAHGYLDDARVAEAHTAIRRDQNLLGRRRVLAELRRRGVEESMAEAAVGDAYGDCDETALAKAFLHRRMGALPARARITEPRHLARLFRALARAGFDSDAIASALAEVTDDGELLESLVDSAASVDLGA